MDQWDRFGSDGLFYGLTTNPTLIANQGLRYADVPWEAWMRTADRLGYQELHVQVIEDDTAPAFCQHLSALAKDQNLSLVFKVPLTPEGIALVNPIKALDHPVLLTACYDASQYLIAEALGAHYIAPYFGRMLDQGIDASAHLREMATMANVSQCQPLIASLRTLEHIRQLAALGHTHFTLAPALAEALTHQPLSQQAAKQFTLAAKTGGKHS